MIEGPISEIFTNPTNLELGDGDYAANTIMLLEGICGVIAFCMVWLPNIRDAKSASSLLFIFLCFPMALICLQLIIYGLTNLIYGRFIFGQIGCYISYLGIVGGLFMVSYSLFLMSICKYMRIFYTQLTNDQIKIIGVGLYALAVLVAGIPLIAGTADYAITMENSKIFCIINWVDRKPTTIVNIIICILTLAFPIATEITLNIKTLNYFKTASKLNPELDESAAKEKKLKKRYLLGGSLMAVWVPYLLMCIYEVASGAMAPGFIHDIADCFAAFSLAFASLVVAVIDQGVASDLKAFWLKKTRVSTKKKPQLSNASDSKFNTLSPPSLAKTIVINSNRFKKTMK